MERNITKAQIVEALKNPMYILYVGNNRIVAVNPDNGNILTSRATNKKEKKNGRRRQR
jgi:hypothetical protein